MVVRCIKNYYNSILYIIKIAKKIFVYLSLLQPHNNINTQEHFPTLCVGKLISTYITMGITLESSKIKISIVIALSIFHLTGTFRFFVCTYQATIYDRNIYFTCFFLYLHKKVFNFQVNDAYYTHSLHL